MTAFCLLPFVLVNLSFSFFELTCICRLSVLFSRLFAHIVSTTIMRSIVTVSYCMWRDLFVTVGHTCEPCKMAESVELPVQFSLMYKIRLTVRNSTS